jgi:hypothetical protein
MAKLAREGVSFTNAHALFPTFTMAIASALVTRHALGRSSCLRLSSSASFQLVMVSSKTVKPRKHGVGARASQVDERRDCRRQDLAAVQPSRTLAVKAYSAQREGCPAPDVRHSVVSAPFSCKLLSAFSPMSSPTKSAAAFCAKPSPTIGLPFGRALKWR